ncbi:MAG TPA: stalk domain-containing protein [Caldisericia bacterium]|nr:stalk domain-containing protein [Caldisericia bacterium]
MVRYSKIMTVVLVFMFLFVSINNTVPTINEPSTDLLAKNINKTEDFQFSRLWVQDPNSPLRISASGDTLSKFTGNVEFISFSKNTGKLEGDVTVEYRSRSSQDELEWGVVPKNAKIKGIFIDGVETKFEENWTDYEATAIVKPKETIKSGKHTLRMVYECEFMESDPENSSYQVFVNGYHAHMYEGWWPHPIDDHNYSDIVSTDINFKMPKTWFMLADFVPEEYRDTPHPKGEYRMLLNEPFAMLRVCAGEYDVSKREANGYDVRMYSFEGHLHESKYFLDITQDTIDFFTDFYEQPCKDDFFIVAMTGQRGHGKGTYGGFIMDSNYLTKETLTPDFVSHEISHIWWWGVYGIIGTPANFRFLSEATAEFSSVLYCDHMSKEYGYKQWMERVDIYRDFKQWVKDEGYVEPPVSSPYAVPSFTLMYHKGSLIFWALMNYMGRENFQKAMIELFNRYGLPDGGITHTYYRPSIGDFYVVFRSFADRDIKGFWDTFINSAEAPTVNYSINRVRIGDDVRDSVKLTNNSDQSIPLKFHIYRSDGTFEEIIHEEGTKNYPFEGHASGIDFVDFTGTIPEVDGVQNSMRFASVAAVIKWRKPAICVSEGDGEQYLARADFWEQECGGKIFVDNFDEVPFKTPIVAVGPTAISQLSNNQFEKLLIRDSGDYLNWRGKKIMGDFETIMVVPEPSDIEVPVIIDNGTGYLPDDLTYTGIFTSEDDRINLAFNYANIFERQPPTSDDMLSLPWSQSDVITDKSAQIISISATRPLEVEYEGFNKETFEFEKITKTFEPGSVMVEMLMDLSSGTKTAKFSHTDRFMQEKWSFDIQLDQSVKYTGPTDVDIPLAISDNSITINWGKNVEHIYIFDGVSMTDWKTGSKLTFTNLEDGKHEFKILFVKDGLLSPLIEKTIYTGAVKPSLEFTDGYALYKNGVVTVHGKTDPGCTVEPGAKVSEDGSFVVEYAASEAPSVLEVISTSPEGMVEKKSISVVRYLKLIMRLGKSEVSDHEGNSWSLDVPPQLVGGSTYVPMRFIGERLGARVEWVATERKVLYYLGLSVVEIWIGKDVAKVNGVEQKMPGPPVIVSGSTLVPVRFVSEALGADVAWFGDEKRIEIEYPKGN